MAPFAHVAVERDQLEGTVKCSPATVLLLVPLLEKLGVIVNHPGLMQPHALSSIGKYLDELNFDAYRQRLVTATGLRATYRVRTFDLIGCEAAEKLPTAQRRQCTAVRGTNELARRLEPHERGGAEVTIAFGIGGALSVIQHRDPRRMVVFLTSKHKVKKALDGKLAEDDAPALAHFFEEAARGQRQAAVAHSPATRHVPLENGASYWILPAWYAEAVAVLAQDVFRLHAFLSAISVDVSRALYVDRVTGHRMTRGQVHEHRTLIKATLHRASGGCACRRHGVSPPTEAFRRLEFRMEFCGCALVNGKCPTHDLQEHARESERFPGVCMLGLKVGLWCAHEGAKSGMRLPMDVRDEKMDLAFAKATVQAVASCGAHLLWPSPSYAELKLDMDASLDHLNDLRLQHAHVGDRILQRDVMAVDLLRRGGLLHPSGRFVGSVRAECNAILKTHKHLFRVKRSK
jgi:hypothetical protein